MATKEQWFTKLKGWFPQWWFETEENQLAVLYGIAAHLERLEGSLSEHVTETFILTALEGYLDEHGSERNLRRLTLESNPLFADRIRNITNTTNCPAIKSIIDALLDVGEATILEDFDAGIYFDREEFISRGELFIIGIYNVFSIIVDKQVHAPYSFLSRENFCDREDFIGTNESSLELFNSIVEAVNRAKALGTLYRLIERAG